MKAKFIIAVLLGMLMQLYSCSSEPDFYSKLSEVDKAKITHEGYSWNDDVLLLDLSDPEKKEIVKELELTGIKAFINDAKDVSNITASNIRRVESPFPADILIEDYVTSEGDIGEVVYFNDDDGTALGATFNKSILESYIEGESFKSMLGDKYDSFNVEGKKIMFLLLYFHLGQVPFVESAENVTIDGKPHRLIGVLSK